MQPFPSLSVVICAYTQDRWCELLAAVESLRRQTLPPQEVIVVVDHNPELLKRIRREISDITAVENQQSQGLSGARNTGIAAARGDVIAFMDEDAVAAPDWVEHLIEGYQSEQILGVGGEIRPRWVDGQPAWLAEEFQWVVGCTYRGMPTSAAPVRNLIGCNMSFRREVFDIVGGFRDGIGRVGTRPLGCEETELCIRTRQHWPQGVILFEPAAKVEHRVPGNRTNVGYFLKRCYSEGLSKAQVTQWVGESDGLASERSYTFRTLPEGVARGLADAFLHRQPAGLGRAAAIVTGLAVTTGGYLVGKIWAGKPVKNPSPPAAVEKADLAAPDFLPTRVVDLEIGQPLADIPAVDVKSAKHYSRLLALIRFHGQPLGQVNLDLREDGLQASDVAAQIWDALGTSINDHLRRDGLATVSGMGAEGLPGAGLAGCVRENTRLATQVVPPASVIVSTRDRADSLALTLDSLLALDYPDYEIIVIDNAPSTEATAELLRNRYAGISNVVYQREDRPGLSNARNRGLRQAGGKILAFTDDDVVVDRSWLTRLAAAFAIAEKVACVTGIIFPAELETPAQAWMEQYNGFNKGFVRKIYNLQEHRVPHPLYPYAAGWFGAGANMAFDAAILKRIGGFDPATGAGTPAMGGDDLAAFFEVVSRGYTLVYEPAALVYHRHRRDYAALHRQAYGYGVGLTAYLTKILLDHPLRILDISARIPSGLVYLFSSRSQKNSGKRADYPQELNRVERRGMLDGPFAYLRSRRMAQDWRLLPDLDQNTLRLPISNDCNNFS
ncbi:MAG: glycosyltransferase [Chloroflexi bacterium]|nr:glycosyltransferase [Chloroflexota bacterium]